MIRYISRGAVDNAGVFLSSACAVHCVAVPLLVTFLPLVGLGFLASEPAEFAIVGAVVLAVGSVVAGVRYHRRYRAFLTLVLAVGVIAAGYTAAEGNFEVILHVTGGVLLATTHLLNRHLCRTCPAADCGPASSTS